MLRLGHEHDRYLQTETVFHQLSCASYFELGFTFWESLPRRSKSAAKGNIQDILAAIRVETTSHRSVTFRAPDFDSLPTPALHHQHQSDLTRNWWPSRNY